MNKSLRHADGKKEVPGFDSFNMHIGFLQSKWVDIIRLQIRKRVINETMRRLIRPDSVNHVQ
jgi:hypothetical protein